MQDRRIYLPAPMPAAAAPTHLHSMAASDFGSADNLSYRELLRRDAACALLREPAPGCGTGATAEITAA
jgi:hypothetical protein